MTSTPVEVQRRYDQLTKRIEALDTDIGREMDSDRRVTLEDRRATLVAERDAVSSELVAKERRSNGDLELLQRKVSDLARVMTSNHPQEAHAIIDECILALGRMDSRILGIEGTVKGHEQRLTIVESHINPPWIVMFWRLCALLVVLFGGLLFLVEESRQALFGIYLWMGLMLEGVLVLLAVACLMLAAAKLRERTR